MFRVYFALQRGADERWTWDDDTIVRDTYALAAADAAELRALTGSPAQVFARWVFE